MKINFNNALAFRTFYSKIKDQRFSLRTGYRLNCIAKALEPHISFYQENITNIINEFAEKDENGKIIPDENGNFKIPTEYIQTCNERINELLELEINIDVKQLSIDELENIEIGMDDLAGISPFITEE